MSLSRQEQIQQQVAAAAAPLVVRNKRGRKVTILLLSPQSLLTVF